MVVCLRAKLANVAHWHRPAVRGRAKNVRFSNRRLGSSTFRLSTTAVLMSLTGSRLSSESAPRPFHHGIRGQGGTISTVALPSV